MRAHPDAMVREPHGGFTKCDRQTILSSTKDRTVISASMPLIQRRHPDSLLNWTERIVRMRKEVPEIGWGDFAILKVRDPAVLAMRYDWRNNSVVFLHNLHDEPREVVLDVGREDEGKMLINLLAEDHSKAEVSGKHRIVLEGYGYRWYPNRRTRLPPPPNSDRQRDDAEKEEILEDAKERRGIHNTTRTLAEIFSVTCVTSCVQIRLPKSAICSLQSEIQTLCYPLMNYD